MPGLAGGGGGQIPDVPVPVLSPTLGGCWMQMFSWGSTHSPCPSRSCGTRWLWATGPLCYPAAASAHLGLCSNSSSSILQHRGHRSMVASIPPFPAWTSIAPACPGQDSQDLASLTQVCQGATTAAMCPLTAMHRKLDKNNPAGETGTGPRPGLKLRVL